MLLIDSRFSVVVHKKAGTCLSYKGLWTGPTTIDISAYMHDPMNSVEAYQTEIAHLVQKIIQIFSFR